MIKRNAAVAGFFIGLGVVINTLAANPILRAFLFSFSLLIILIYKFFLMVLLNRKIKDLFNSTSRVFKEVMPRALCGFNGK